MERLNISAELLARKLVDFCMRNNRRTIFISGNGGSGKSELSRIIVSEALQYGHVNTLDMDDFVVDTELRKNSIVYWDDKERGRINGSYSTSFEGSYFLQNIKAILVNINKGNNYYHWPKKAKSPSECRLLYADAIITIVEGVGSVFLDFDKESSLGVFMQCSKEIEIERRVSRAKFSNEQNRSDVLKNYDIRNSQFEANILPHKDEFELVLESLADFTLDVISDGIHVIS